MYSSPHGSHPSPGYYQGYTWAPSSFYTRTDDPSVSRRRRATVDEIYRGYSPTSDGSRYYSQQPQDPYANRASHHSHKHEKRPRQHERKSSRRQTTYDIHVDSAGRTRCYASARWAESDESYNGEDDSSHDFKYRTSPPPEQQQHTRQTRSYPGVYTTTRDYDRAESTPRRANESGRMECDAAKSRHSSGATEADARRARIPAGYSLKYWDPLETPIILAGSVFDANSLGKWIYDWTVAAHGPATPFTEVAGDLWLLLIQLAAKIKRAEERVDIVRDRDDRELIGDFIDSGGRIWARLEKLLKICETYMMKHAKKSKGKTARLGTDSGIRFIKCIFGREKELERTEKLMAGIRLWSVRFDANCDDILRRA